VPQLQEATKGIMHMPSMWTGSLLPLEVLPRSLARNEARGGWALLPCKDLWRRL